MPQGPPVRHGTDQNVADGEKWSESAAVAALSDHFSELTPG
jgi:hypothetical protein